MLKVLCEALLGSTPRNYPSPMNAARSGRDGNDRFLGEPVDSDLTSARAAVRGGRVNVRDRAIGAAWTVEPRAVVNRTSRLADRVRFAGSPSRDLGGRRSSLFAQRTREVDCQADPTPLLREVCCLAEGMRSRRPGIRSAPRPWSTPIHRAVAHRDRRGGIEVGRPRQATSKGQRRPRSLCGAISRLHITSAGSPRSLDVDGPDDRACFASGPMWSRRSEANRAAVRAGRARVGDRAIGAPAPAKLTSYGVAGSGQVASCSMIAPR
jgi:hypothetical protein